MKLAKLNPLLSPSSLPLTGMLENSGLEKLGWSIFFVCAQDQLRSINTLSVFPNFCDKWTHEMCFQISKYEQIRCFLPEHNYVVGRQCERLRYTEFHDDHVDCSHFPRKNWGLRRKQRWDHILKISLNRRKILPHEHLCVKSHRELT